MAIPQGGRGERLYVMYDAGWYQDPAVPQQGRYYDGTDWTEHTVAIPPGSRLPLIGETILAGIEASSRGSRSASAGAVTASPTTAMPTQQAGTTFSGIYNGPAAYGGSGALGLIGNVVWLIFGGLWLGLSYLAFGCLLCLTIVGIPFGVQAFKLAGFSFWPFGKAVIPVSEPSATKGCLNLLWLVGAGLWLAVEHVVVGLIFCITIVGIPFGLQNFKLAQFALWPFGMAAVPIGQIPYGVQPIIVVRQLGS